MLRVVVSGKSPYQFKTIITTQLDRDSISCFADHYSKIAERYDEIFTFMYGPLADLIIEQLHITPTDKVLDVGAATGGLAHTIWKKAGT